MEQKSRQNLRKIAEGKLDWTKIDTIQDEELKKAIHELNVHQVELEIQNEELINTQNTLEQTRDEFKYLYDFAPVGYCTLNEEGIIYNMNLTLASMMDITRNNGNQRSFYDFITNEDKDLLYLHLRKIFSDENTGKKKSVTLHLHTHSGSILCVQLESMLEKDKQYAYSAVIDITEKKHDEEALQKAHEELREMNSDLEQKVEERTDQILMLLEQKDEFINQLAHDLKNPLGPLLNLLPILEVNEADPKQKEMLHVINRNVSYMKNLVTKTIQLAQLKSPSTGLKYEEIDLGAEIADVLENNKIHFEQNHICVHNNITEKLMIEADKLKLQVVFNNLLNNAVKYNKKEEGEITISHLLSDGEFTLSIKDEGIGMTADQLEHVFDEFYKADNSRHDFESSGLGMPICKKIIEMHGGRIWVESEGLGKGSTIYFTLPLNK